MTKAQEGWNQSKEGRWIVADEAYTELETSEYADGVAKTFGESLRPPVSDDTVYRLARAGRVFQELLEFEPEITAGLRKCLTDNYFEAASELLQSDAIEWLMQAVEEGWKIERFRAEISDHEGKPIDWNKRLKTLENQFINSTFFGFEQKHVKRIVRLAKMLVRAVREAGGGSPQSDEPIGKVEE